MRERALPTSCARRRACAFAADAYVRPMIAEDVMTREPVTVTEVVSIADALEVLSDEAVRHLPVVRGNDIVGILSDRDFRALGVTGVRGIENYERLRGRLSEPVSVLMTSGVVTVDRDAE